MKKFYVCLSVLAFFIGVLMAINPLEFIKITTILFGIESFLSGLFKIFRLQNFVTTSNLKKMVLTRGVFALIVGIIAMTFPFTFSQAFWKIVFSVLAIYLIFEIFFEIVVIIELKRLSISIRFFVCGVILLAIFAFMFLTIPLDIAKTLIRVVGICLAVFTLAFFRILTK